MLSLKLQANEAVWIGCTRVIVERRTRLAIDATDNLHIIREEVLTPEEIKELQTQLQEGKRKR